MHIRYRYVTYRYTDGSQQQLDRHYRQLLHDALRQSHQSILQRSATWRPLADIRESTGMMTIKIELAGVREEDIEVTLYEDALVVSGERQDDAARSENLYYHEAQIRYGPFRVEVLILSPIDRDGIQARYENGFLWVNLSKKLPEDKAERIHPATKGEELAEELSPAAVPGKQEHSDSDTGAASDSEQPGAVEIINETAVRQESDANDLLSETELAEEEEGEQDEERLSIPDVLPILPLKDIVIYPFAVQPLGVGQERSIRLIDDVMRGDRLVVLVAQKS